MRCVPLGSMYVQAVLMQCVFFMSDKLIAQMQERNAELDALLESVEAILDMPRAPALHM